MMTTNTYFCKTSNCVCLTSTIYIYNYNYINYIIIKKKAYKSPLQTSTGEINESVLIREKLKN